MERIPCREPLQKRLLPKNSRQAKEKKAILAQKQGKKTGWKKMQVKFQKSSARPESGQKSA
ncbi:MAG: hypothetical protein J6Y30_10995 [Treponema sp.]|nr:hypothetical protein [Treponema sp.]